ncbi:16S rRNA (cytosine(1402)-N(4))-methyltransferase [Candidatus Kaiserbacteria bacterium]|nr:16S rRNA (cytosine(1402)-N(4))-methyltransferase [Candidatus Kaiserbacteria bacterium]
MSEENTKDSTRHIPVLLAETVAGLALRADATVIDATLGNGGHFSAILEKLGPKGTLFGIDADPIAVARAAERVALKDVPYVRVLFATGNFRNIAALAKTQGLTYADAIVADLGWRMEQFSGERELGGGKGFSFSADEPLAMTFGDPEHYPFTAADIVNEWKEEDIANVIFAYGEERYSRPIARAIVRARAEKRIETARELAEIISEAVRKRGALSQDLASSFGSEANQKSHKVYSTGTVPERYRHGRIHPATKTFQALRIAVNDEIDALKEFIAAAVDLLSPGGILAIISFHSIEDRIVKHAFAGLETEGRMRRITKKPIIPAEEELSRNPRARSARLRIVQKI